MREVSNAEWDDIQDRLNEKDAELEQLKARITFMASNDYVYSLTSLISRAADALETYPVGSGWNLLLIDELRKAAQ